MVFFYLHSIATEMLSKEKNEFSDEQEHLMMEGNELNKKRKLNSWNLSVNFRLPRFK